MSGNSFRSAMVLPGKNVLVKDSNTILPYLYDECIIGSSERVAMLN